MINYIVEENKISTMFYKNEYLVCDTYEALITKIFKAHFFNYSYYKNMIGKTLGLKNGAPIYLTNKLMFIKFREGEKIYYINYFAINFMSYNENTIFVIFKNGILLSFNKSKNNIKKKEEMIHKVLEYMNYLENSFY